MSDESKDLLVPIPIASPLAVFTEINGLDPYLKRVRNAIDEWECPGVDTRKGRDEIAAFAYKISRSKTALEEAGKELAASQKEIPRKIDAARKFMRDTLDAWRDEVRAPLTKWEQAEETRISAHKINIADLAFWGDHRNIIDKSARELHSRREIMQRARFGPECEEFELEYIHANEAAIAALTKAIETREKYESEQAELARLREEKLAREQAERDAKIAREAADRATREAEERQRREIEAALQAQRKAEQDALWAQKQAEAVQEWARRHAEGQRLAEAEEAAQRAADARHKAQIHQDAYESLVRELDHEFYDGDSHETAKFVLRLIAEGKIPHVRFIY